MEVRSGALFSPHDSEVYTSFVSSLPAVFLRNFRRHETVRKIEIGHYVSTMALHRNLVLLGTADRLILVLQDATVKETLVGHSDSVAALVSYEGVLVSCSGGEIIKWQPPALHL